MAVTLRGSEASTNTAIGLCPGMRRKERAGGPDISFGNELQRHDTGAPCRNRSGSASLSGRRRCPIVSLPGGASAPLTAADIYTVAGNGIQGFTSDGVPATSAELGAPGGVTVDPHGNVLIADTANNRIRVVAQTTGAFYGQSMTDGFTYTIAGTGTAGVLPSTPVPAVSALLAAPAGVALDAHGNVVIADTGANRIAVVAESTGSFYGQSMIDGDIYTIAGSGVAGTGPLPTVSAVSASLNAPAGVALDAHGNVVIADTGANQVAVVAESNGTFYGALMTAGDIYRVVGTGVGGFIAAPTPPLAVAAALFAPTGVTVDPHGNVVIADTKNNRVEVVPAGNGTFYGQSMQAQRFYTVAGDNGAGFGTGDGNEAVMSSLGTPKSVALDAQGNLVIADTADNRVRVVAESSATFYGQAMTDEDIYTVPGMGPPPTTVTGSPPRRRASPLRVTPSSTPTATSSSPTPATPGSAWWRRAPARSTAWP